MSWPEDVLEPGEQIEFRSSSGMARFFMIDAAVIYGAVGLGLIMLLAEGFDWRRLGVPLAAVATAVALVWPSLPTLVAITDRRLLWRRQGRGRRGWGSFDRAGIRRAEFYGGNHTAVLLGEEGMLIHLPRIMDPNWFFEALGFKLHYWRPGTTGHYAPGFSLAAMFFCAAGFYWTMQQPVPAALALWDAGFGGLPPVWLLIAAILTLSPFGAAAGAVGGMAMAVMLFRFLRPRDKWLGLCRHLACPRCAGCYPGKPTPVEWLLWTGSRWATRLACAVMRTRIDCDCEPEIQEPGPGIESAAGGGDAEKAPG